jgi:hypothetical protein
VVVVKGKGQEGENDVGRIIHNRFGTLKHRIMK